MEDGKTAGDLLRLVGVMTILVGLAWVVQVLGFGGPGMGRFMWVVSAAAVCGAGVGLLVTSASLVDEETAGL